MSLQRKQINLLSHQYRFLRSKAKFCALIGGIGSGKTFAGSTFILESVIESPEALHFIGANTYSQLQQATLVAMFNLLDTQGIEYTFNKVDGILRFCGGTVLCKSMDNFEMHRGIEIGSFWLDESRDLKQAAFDMMMGRLRDRRAKRLRGRITSSPSGRNWIYDYFHKSGEKNNPDFELIHATSFDNTYLPDGYIDSIKSMYSDEFYQQEILGEFISGGRGMIFPWAAAHNYPPFVEPIDINKWMLLIGLDPASTSTFGVIFFLHNTYTKQTIAFDEIYEQEMSKMTARSIWDEIQVKAKPYLDRVKDVMYVLDEAAAWYRAEVYEYDHKAEIFGSEKHKYGVDGYIIYLRQFMKVGLLTITDKCPRFRKELEGYIRDDKGKIPKVNDHLINAAQYALTALGYDLSELSEPGPKQEEPKRYFKIEDDFKTDSYAELD